MPRQAHLPPRCPYRRKTDDHALYDTVLPKMRKDIALNQRFIKEDQPTWINDLLDDESESKPRRGVSETDSLKLSVDLTNIKDTSGSKYGPNSPRGIGKPTFHGNNIASVLSEYVRYKHTQKNLDESFSASKVGAFESEEDTLSEDYVRYKHTRNKNESFSVSKVVGDFEFEDEDTCGSNGEVMIPENKLVKRHPGQRTKMRKLQYIAELEKTVDILQEMESDLATGVSSLVHQRLSLSVENTKLKQRIVRLQQRKLIADGQTQALRKEFEMLKYNMNYYGIKKGGNNNNNNNSCSNVNSILLGSSVEPNWKMLDIGKLNLN